MIEDSVIKADEASYRVRLEVFEGPLDLLLHLIRKNRLDIFDIPVSMILSQYLEYLDLMREFNLGIAGEFLEMAATLAYIKSRMLLPRHDEEEESEEDPRSGLIATLMEYARVKEAARELGGRDVLGRDIFLRGASDEFAPEEQEFEVGLFELTSAFVDLMRRAETAPPLELEVDVHTLREKMVELLEAVKASAQEGLTLQGLIQGISSRMEAIILFLAVLELIRLRAVRAFQHAPNAAIRMFPGANAWIPLPLVEEL